MATRVLHVDKDAPDMRSIEEAAQIVRRGGIVAFPTETVYGLACNAARDDAVKKMYALKEREKGKPFTIHIAAQETITHYAVDINAQARKLMRKYWPGPLTMVLPLNESYSGDERLALAPSFEKIIESIHSVGFRFPRHAVAQKFIETCNVPIAAPSANKSGNNSPMCADDVLNDFDGDIELIIDSGPTEYLVGSTVVKCFAETVDILRVGAVASDEIKKCVEDT
ncbi:MAG: L-threonylcarbamoyladenylate synthase [Candidatus Ancaeobacter aquaticus]|nr:L-threonylcarbamoyladenylate synthase [Candidatus Ancaeobacter aquaticus]